ncbi:unnamed protein product [Aureobasidium uvarum]|uniref:DUF4211 domain-containing protein n=1 Tax=Aureobasidium uvarum TaxID=2773716 RepID=A0A9N8PMH5_9PEZI|nr:unnamed protein product [Aureobasidium uvarum]
MPRSSKRQTRLTFDPLPTSSSAPSDISKSQRDRAATVRFEGASPSKRRKVRDAPGASSLATVVAHDMPEKSLPPTPDPSATNSFGASAVSDDEIRHTQRLSSRKSQKKQQKLDLTPSSPRAAINNARPVRAGFFGTQQQLDADSSDSDQDLPKLPIRSQKNSKRQKKHKSPSPEVEEEEVVVQEPPTVISHESEDDLPATPALNRKRKRQAESSSPLALIPDDEDDDSDVVVTGSRKRSLSSKKRAPPPPELDTDLDLSDEPPSSRSRKRLRRVKDAAPMSTITEEEKQELEDDLMDLASSGSDTEVRVSQRNKSSQKSARQLALERLKARRKAPMSSIVEDEDDEDEEQADEEEEYAQSSDEDGEEDYDDLPELSTHRTTRKQMFAEDEEDEGFVIDDDGPLGVPTNVPIAFTRYASMKAKDLFRFAIDWMVQKKINPAFQMDDEIYDLTFKKLDDEVKGLAGSKFQSAAWTSTFTLALQARPDLLSARLDRQSSAHFGRDKCDACNRTGHPATYEIKFEGKPYDKNSLEPVAPRKDPDDEEDDDDDDSNSESSVDSTAPINHDSMGRHIASEETVFYLGKFCMSNAETAHSLQHWRYHLYEWVVEWLESAGWNTPKLIVKRDGWSVRKRRKHANKIVDIMEEQGKIKALYSDFKKEIDTARNAKQGRWDSSP